MGDGAMEKGHFPIPSLCTPRVLSKSENWLEKATGVASHTAALLLPAHTSMPHPLGRQISSEKRDDDRFRETWRGREQGREAATLTLLP